MDKIVKGMVIGILVVVAIVLLWNMRTEEYAVLDQNGAELGKISVSVNADGCEIAKDAASVANIMNFECDRIQTGTTWEVVDITDSGSITMRVNMLQKTVQLFTP